MSTEKPVELTEEETRIALVLFDCGAASSLAEAEDDVREVVAAREAAVRREAEDDPAHARMYRALVERAERAEAEVATARREALLEAAAHFESEMGPAWGDNRSWFTTGKHVTSLVAEVLRELAEPERDEEGGR